MDRNFLLLGAVAGFLGVALGAFGAHGLRGRLSPEMLAVFETGVRYHMYHALALVLVSLVMTGDDQIRRGEGSSTVSIPGFTFDIRKIGERATLLFPFLTPGLSLEHFAIAPRREVSDGYRNPFAPASPATPQAGPRRPALVMTSAAMQSLVDQSWSRRDRWSPFQRIMALADRYSADTGKLPALLHEYQAQNGLQPYVDSSMRDPRLWTELGLAADHVRFIGFISRYVTEHRSTRAATELLFLLDKLVQAARTRSSRCWTPSRRRSCAGRATRIRRRT